MNFYLKFGMSQDIPIPKVWEEEKLRKYYATLVILTKERNKNNNMFTNNQASHIK